MRELQTEPNQDLTNQQIKSKRNLTFNVLRINSTNNNQRREITNNINRISNEDSIAYFVKKLENQKYDYKVYSFCCFILYFLDLIICIKNKKFKFLYNQIILILLIISLISNLIIFRHNFESFSQKIYESTKKLICIQLIILLFFYIDLFYIIFKKGLFKKGENDDIQSNMNFLMGTFMPYLIFIVANLIFPGFLWINLVIIKKSIKKLNYIKEEEYQVLKMGDF